MFWQKNGEIDKNQCIKLFEQLTNYRYVAMIFRIFFFYLSYVLKKEYGFYILVLGFFPFIMLTCETWYAFLFPYRTLPKISKEEFGLIFDELDDTRDFKVHMCDGGGTYDQGIHLKITIHINLLTDNRFFFPFLFHIEQINKDEFADLCQAIALRFQKEEVVSPHILYFPSLSKFTYLFTICLHYWSFVFSLQPSLFENFPQIYHSALSQQLRAFVRSPNFGYAISFILVINFIAVVVETTVYHVPIKCISLIFNS